MKRILTSLFILFFITLAYSGAVISDFQAVPGFNKVEIKWVVTAESNLKGYRILRSDDNVSFQRVDFVEALGVTGSERTYTYVDESVFKSNGNTYYYKIEFINKDESVSAFSKIVTVNPQISSSRKTWGSIKAMFR